MTTNSDEVDILEKVARHRVKLGFDDGILLLTNQRLRFQPKYPASVFLAGLVGFALSFIGFAMMFVLLYMLYVSGYYEVMVADPRFYMALAFIIPMMAIGIVLGVVAYVKRNRKEFVIALKDIADVTVGTRANDMFVIPVAGRKERFVIDGAAEFMGETWLALRGDQAAIESLPTSLLNVSYVEVPRFTVPENYPGALLRLRRRYSTPKICCMCGESASEKATHASTSLSGRMKKVNARFAWRLKPKTPYTHPFPVCVDCARVQRRAKLAGLFGGAVGLIIGGAVFVLFLFSGYFFATAGFLAQLISFLGILGEFAALLFSFFLIMLLTGGIGAIAGRLLAVDLIALHRIPKEKKPFYEVVAENKGIRIARSRGYVAFGFLNKDFAATFCQMNNGISTAIAPPVAKST